MLKASHSGISATILGVTLPFFAVDMFRIGVPGGMRLPPAALAVTLLASIGIIRALLRFHRSQVVLGPHMKILIGLMAAMLSWHLLGVARAENLDWALVEVIKLGVGMAVFWLILIFVPLSRLSIESSIVISLWIMTGLLLFYIYVYGFLFHAPYLGIVLDEPSRVNRNQLAWMLAVMIPYVVSGYFSGKRPWLFAIPLLVFIAAAVYTSSRGMWVCGGLGAVWVFWEGGRVLRSRGVMRLIVIGSLCVVMAVIAMNKIGPGVQSRAMDFTRKASSFTDAHERHGEYSFGVREKMLIDSVAHFTNAPIFGMGLTNLRNVYGHVSHNDFLGILAEQGIVGFLLFVLVLGTVNKVGFMKEASGWLEVGARGSLVALSVYLLFINVYTTTMFWTIAALALVATRSILDERSSGVDVVR